MTPSQIEETFSRFGHVSYIGKLLTIVLLDQVPFNDLVPLTTRPEVAMVQWRQPMHPEIDVASRAVEAHKSAVFTMTAEDAGLDGSGIVIAFIGTGVTSAGFSQLNGKLVAGFDASDPSDPGDGSTNPTDTGFHETAMALIAVGAPVTGQTCRNPGTGSTANCGGIATGATTHRAFVVACVHL